MNWLSSVSHINEEILNAFIENEVDAEVTDKESEQEVSFNLFILNDLAVYEKIIDCSSVEPSGKIKQPYIQYELAPKLKCPVFDPSSLNCDSLAYKNFLMQFENRALGMHDKALELLILKTHLRSNALKIVTFPFRRKVLIQPWRFSVVNIWMKDV